MNKIQIVAFFLMMLLFGGVFAQDSSNEANSPKSLKEISLLNHESEEFIETSAKIHSLLAKAEERYTSDVANISVIGDVSIEKVADVFESFEKAKAETRDVCLILGVAYKPCTVIISDELADVGSFKKSGLIPSALAGKTVIVVRSEFADSDALDSLLAYIYEGASTKSAKKLAESENPDDDFRLAINIVYFDDKLVQHIERAPDPTSVTSGNTKTFMARGGTHDYIWYLDTNYGSSIAGTGDTITYRASTISRGGTDVLYVNDGFSEASIRISSGYFRTETDGSGARGNKSSGCFIRSKSRD